MRTGKNVKRHLALILSVLLTVTAIPQFAAAAVTKSQDVKLEEGTYVPGQVIVMFRDNVIEESDDSLKEVRSMAQIGSDFGAMEGAVSESAAAASIAESEADHVDNSLGSDFTIEDTLVFPAGSSDADGGIGIESEDDEGFSVALISSDKYDTETMIEKLSRNSSVAAVEPNYRTYLTDIDGYDSYSLNDKYARWLYHDNAPAARNRTGDSVDALGADPDAAVSANAASGWKKLNGKEKEVVVAVVDTGINPNHEDLKYRLWTNPGDIGLAGEHGYNFADNNTDITDHEGHGTHCAGLIAAQANNGRGVAGVSGIGNVKIMALCINPSSTDGSLYTAMGSYNYVLRAKEKGVNIVATSNSWGRGDTQSTIFDEIVNRMGEAGIVSFYAAGNSSDNLDYRVDNPSATDSDYSVVVGAAGITGEPAGFSNYGRQAVDVFASGVNTLSAIGKAVYFPTINTRSERRGNTEYYGEFTKNTKVKNGTVTPDNDDTLLSSVDSFGAMKFHKQPSSDYAGEEGEETPSIPDTAKCEVEVSQDRYFNTGTKASLKVTIKNAQYGEDYYVYFPYKKNRKTEEDNTAFSIMYQNGDTSDAGYADVYGGEVIEEKDGTCSMTNFGIHGHPMGSADRDVATHLSSKILTEGDEPDDNSYKMCSYSELGRRKCGIGLHIFPAKGVDGTKWEDGQSHDLVLYIDSLGVSKPNAKIDPNSSYDIMSGTSMACPSAAGAGALMALLNPRMDGQSGAEYATMIRNKLFESVHKTDALSGLCSTGGYIDFRYMNSGQPVINDAVCNVDKGTLTIRGKNLNESGVLTYRKLDEAASSAVELPSGGMDLSYSADGSKIVISNAKSLFGTYIEFEMTSESGESGKGSFFTVKGQNELKMVSSILYPNPADDDYYNSHNIQLATNASGSCLYGVENDTGKVMRFNGREFVDIPGTLIKDTVVEMLSKDYDQYQIENQFEITPVHDQNLLNDGNMIYYNVNVNHTPEGSEETEYTEYLASLDLSARSPEWTLHEYNVSEIEEEYSSISRLAVNGRIYILVSTYGKDYSLFYSFDPESNVLTKEATLPVFVHNAYMTEYNGSIYVMFGSTAPDGVHEKLDQISEGVYRFDGSSWKRTGTLRYAGKRDSGLGSDYPEYTAAAGKARNGLVILDMSIDGEGNCSLYDPESDTIRPIYYTLNDSHSDNTMFDCRSSVATKKGIYYLRDYNDEMRRGWALYLLPASSGEYESAYGADDSAAAAKVRKTKVTLKSVKAGKGKMTVKWKANKAVFGGYQIKYRIKGKSWNSVSVNKASAASKVIKKLKKGCKYQVKVRGYKVIDGSRVYGKYSKTKTSGRIR